MVIQCPECTTRFKLADDKLKPEGVKVRCAKCRHIFTVSPDTSPETVPTESIGEAPVVASDSAAQFAEKNPEEETEFQDSATDDLWGSGFTESDFAPPDNLGTKATDKDTPPVVDDWSLGFDESPDRPGDEQVLTTQEETASPAAEANDADELEFSLVQESEPETEDAPADADEWSDSFDESDLELSSTDDLAAESTSPESAFQLDDSWGEVLTEDAAPTGPTEEIDETDLGLEEELSSDAFSPKDENIDEFVFAEEPEAGDSPPTDEFSFTEETPAEAGEGLSDYSFEVSNDDEFSFESDSGDTAEAFSFDKDDLFAPDVESSSEASETDEIAFDEPAEKGTVDNVFDFDDMSFSEKEGTAPEGETDEPIAPVQRESIVEKPAAEQPPLLEQEINPPSLPKQKRKSPMSNVLRIFLALLLALGSAAGYLIWQGNTKDILQSIKQFTGQQEPILPEVQIRLPLPNSFFILNKEAGQLFVVQGEAINGYPENRSAIAVKGMLHDEKGNVLMQQTVFCGNSLDHEELQTATFAQLEESMNNQFGNALSNLNVGPGKPIPYMIIFRDLPDNVTEFTVEVADSKPGGQQ